MQSPLLDKHRTQKGTFFYEVKNINGYQCTLTAWENRDIMLAFMKSGVHLKAMKSFRKIATGKTYGYESANVPSWSEAFDLLQSSGKEY
jgi:hypothetical protein